MQAKIYLSCQLINNHKIVIDKKQIANKLKAMNALLLFSGGLDSTTLLYWAKKRYKKILALTFDYGQRHSIEIQMSEKVLAGSGFDNISHRILKIDLSQIGGSVLTDLSMAVPDISYEEIGKNIPATYVPFRNGIFLSIAAAMAEKEKIQTIIGGWNQLDYSGYPDCRTEFIKSMESTINLGTQAGSTGTTFNISAPLIDKTKCQIIKLGKENGADYSYSYSCYKGDLIPCGHCDSCKLRQAAFTEAGINDDYLVKIAKKS